MLSIAKSVLMLAALAPAFVAAPAAAQSPLGRLYVNVGYTSVTTGANDGDDDDFNFGTVTGRVGFRFHRYVGVEGEASFGVKKQHQLISGQRVDLDLGTQVAGYVVGFLPLSDRADVLARVGYGNIEYRLNGGPFNKLSDDKASLNYGVGVQWLFDGQNGVRLDFTRYDLKAKGADDNAIGVSFVHRF